VEIIREIQENRKKKGTGTRHLLMLSYMHRNSAKRKVFGESPRSLGRGGPSAPRRSEGEH